MSLLESFMEPAQNPAPIATVSPKLVKQLPVVMIAATLGIGALIAIAIFVLGKPEWWPAFYAAIVVAALSALFSVMIILRSAGKPADYVVTMVMLLSVVRVAVSLIGLMICVLALKIMAIPVTVMICSYYFVTLLVESILISKALKAPDVI